MGKWVFRQVQYLRFRFAQSNVFLISAAFCAFLVCPCAAESAEQVLMLKRHHIFMGEMTSYLGKQGTLTSFDSLGFENLNLLKEPNKTLIFNREKKLLYLGSEKNARELNRVSILAGMSARTNSANFTWGNEKWSVPKSVTYCGVKCDYLETEKNREVWKVWVLKEPKYPDWINRTVSEWMRLPNLGGIAFRAIRKSKLGKERIVMDVISAKLVPAPANFLQPPSGFRKTNNVADVCTAHDSFLNDVLDTLK